MCVKLVTENKVTSYNMEIPLEKQLVGCKQIVIDFKPHDPQFEKFLDEVERFVDQGLQFKLNVKVVHNGQLLGAKIKKQIKHLEKEFDMNELIKLMALTYDRTDRTLEEMANFCKSKNCAE